VRTVIAITAGIVVSFCFAFLSRSLGWEALRGSIFFIVVWLLFCLFDYQNGVKAGYAASNELRIHLLVFAVPALAAWLLARRLS
jgi:hypothetical protein